MASHSDSRTDADREHVDDRLAAAIKRWLTREGSPFPDSAQDQDNLDTFDGRPPLRIDPNQRDLANLTAVHEEDWFELELLSDVERGYCLGRVYAAIDWLQHCLWFHGSHSRIGREVGEEFPLLKTKWLHDASLLAIKPVSACISYFDFGMDGDSDFDMDEWSAYREELDTGESGWSPDQLISPIDAFQKWFESPLDQTVKLAMELGWLMDRGLRPLYYQADPNGPPQQNPKRVPNQIANPSQNPSSIRRDEIWVRLVRAAKRDLADALEKGDKLRFLRVPHELSIERLDTFDKAIRDALPRTHRIGAKFLNISLIPASFSLQRKEYRELVTLKKSRFRMIEILVQNQGTLDKEGFLNCYRQNYPKPKKDEANALAGLVFELNKEIEVLGLKIYSEGLNWNLASLHDANRS